MPRCWNYTQRRTKSWAFTAGPLEMYFSYETCIAFRDRDDRLVVTENDWGPTTGRHLDELDHSNRKNRLPRREFLRELGEYLDSIVVLPRIEDIREAKATAAA